MGAFQIIFLAVNLAVPYWLWSRSSSEAIKIDWPTWEKNVARLIDSDGGFPGCSTLRVVDLLRDLCEASRGKMKNNESIAVERGSKDIVFSCEFRKETITISWRLESTAKAEYPCGDPGGDAVARAPGFVFLLNGRMKSIEFTSEGGQAQVFPYRNCRAKANLAQRITSSPATIDEFLKLLGTLPDDPQDFITANRLCFTFDSSSLWRPWRKKYLR